MIKIYLAHRMTNRYKDELLREAEYTTRSLTNHGFQVLDPILEENLTDEHELLIQLSKEQLERYWKRDKEMLKEAHLMIDYMSCNKSDGVSKELGYTRFCLWKPTIRVFPKMGINISMLEDDVIVETLEEAINVVKERWGTKEKLMQWRMDLLKRCMPKFLQMQAQFLEDLNALSQESR